MIRYLLWSHVVPYNYDLISPHFRPHIITTSLLSWLVHTSSEAAPYLHVWGPSWLSLTSAFILFWRKIWLALIKNLGRPFDYVLTCRDYVLVGCIFYHIFWGFLGKLANFNYRKTIDFDHRALTFVDRVLIFVLGWLWPVEEIKFLASLTKQFGGHLIVVWPLLTWLTRAHW